MSEQPAAHDTIAVVDFGGQYAHLIANRLRAMGVFSVIVDPHAPLSAYEHAVGVILSGSPALASAGEESGWNTGLFELPIPIFGFCFGHQEIARHYGGEIRHQAREYGLAELHVQTDSPLLAGLGAVEQVFMSHGDTVTTLGAGFVELGLSRLGDGPVHRNAAIADETRKRYGVQFHPEVDDTPNGARMIANFALDICGARPTWKIADHAGGLIAQIQQEVGDRGVFLLVSGGVDSAVCAWLLARALGPDRLHLLHIDNGMMRAEESAGVVAALREHGVSDNVHFIDATDQFLSALAGVVEPEEKRHIIGRVFVEVFQQAAERIGIADYLLAQGTIYPDTIETGATKRSDRIKTHHNRVPIIEEMLARGQVIEPLADLYKVEVRQLGRALGIPEQMVSRHPFPGPGLGVRCLCADSVPDGFDAATLSAWIDPIVGPRGFTALPLPVRSVGVKADLRCFDLPVMLHGDRVPHETLEVLAGSIFKNVPAINRCVLWLGAETPRRATLHPATMTAARLAVLRAADAAVMDGLSRHGLMAEIWQCPTVLVPVEIDGEGDGRAGELIVVRPVLSKRAMTARAAALPEALLAELWEEISALDGVCGVALDLTSKPPGTIEWE